MKTAQLLEIAAGSVDELHSKSRWHEALETGGLLYLPRLGFELTADERTQLLRAEVLAADSRNISLDENGVLKGAAADEAALKAMMSRFREQALAMVALAALLHGSPARGTDQLSPA